MCLNVLFSFAGDKCFHALKFKRLKKNSSLPLFYSLAEQKGSYSTLSKEKMIPCSSECGTEPVCISGISNHFVFTDQYYA